MTGIGWPLLLTATIRPQRILYNAILDPLTRFWQYAYALTSWSRSQHASPIVLVDNSLSDDYGKRLESVAASEGCEFEFLTFQGDEGASEVSKAFGDGQCIDYALSHSKTLSSASGFYKCTGRTAVTNLADFERANLGRKNAFAILGVGQRSGPMDLLNTGFFRCETAWFGHHLRHAYRNANDSADATLEMIISYAIGKKAAAKANHDGKRLAEPQYMLITQVCDEILAGKHGDMFPLHVG